MITAYIYIGLALITLALIIWVNNLPENKNQKIGI